jgi:hypothetical protein
MRTIVSTFGNAPNKGQTKRILENKVPTVLICPYTHHPAACFYRPSSRPLSPSPSSTMILAHKPMAPHFALPAAVNAHHRRHPSAPPAVVVQPTRTPGLLSLSKPAHVQRQVQRPSPKTKQFAPTSPVLKAQPKVAQVQPAPHNNRGRSQNKPKDKPTRYATFCSLCECGNEC